MKMVRRWLVATETTEEELVLLMCGDKVFGHGDGAIVFGDDAVDPWI